jgi:serine/threonine protein kinase, bacterial
MKVTELRGYRIVRPLGQGGFGKTFLAEDMHSKSQQQCVLKQFSPQATDTTSYQIAQERFQKEAMILLELSRKHSQIPKLYSYFCHDEDFYLVMEYIEGQTLAQKVKEQGALPAAVVEQILKEILQILEVVHGENIIHRDIKPDNIIIRDSDQKPVLIDFGAVKECLHTLLHGQYAATSIVIGSPGYIAPEQAAGRPGYFSDIYSLGMTAIYALTGKSLKELHSQFHPSSLRWQEYAPPLPTYLAAIINKAVQMHPSDRYATATLMLQDLIANAEPIPVTATPQPMPSHPPVADVNTFSPATVAVHPKPDKSAPDRFPDDASVNPTVNAGLTAQSSLGYPRTGRSRLPAWLLGGLVATGVMILGLTGIYAYQWLANQSLTPSPSVSNGTGTSNNNGFGRVAEGEAISLLEKLYVDLSRKDYDAAKSAFTEPLVHTFSASFFNQFKRVSIENLQISSRTDSSINFIGDNTYIWPDGSTQREQRSFAVRNINGKLLITSSEFIKVLQPRQHFRTSPTP